MFALPIIGVGLGVFLLVLRDCEFRFRVPTLLVLTAFIAALFASIRVLLGVSRQQEISRE